MQKIPNHSNHHKLVGVICIFLTDKDRANQNVFVFDENNYGTNEDMLKGMVMGFLLGVIMLMWVLICY